MLIAEDDESLRALMRLTVDDIGKPFSRRAARHDAACTLSWSGSQAPPASFRREHVAQQVERACRREDVAGEDGLARVLRRDHDARRRFRRSVAISHGAMFRDPAQFERAAAGPRGPGAANPPARTRTSE